MSKTNKREIDKELMFSKIMPSGLSSPPKEGEEGEVSLPPELPVQPPAAVTAAAPASSGPGVQFKEKEQQILVNVVEYLVVDKLDAAFAKFNCCKCDKCRKDVAAIALNKLHPKYVVTEADKVHALTALLNPSDAATAIIQAILHVRSHPRHG